MNKRDPNTGQYAQASENQAVVDASVDTIKANRILLVKLEKKKSQKRKEQAKKRLEAKADNFLKSENPLTKGLLALTSKE